MPLVLTNINFLFNVLGDGKVNLSPKWPPRLIPDKIHDHLSSGEDTAAVNQAENKQTFQPSEESESLDDSQSKISVKRHPASVDVGETSGSIKDYRIKCYSGSHPQMENVRQTYIDRSPKSTGRRQISPRRSPIRMIISSSPRDMRYEYSPKPKSKKGSPRHKTVSPPDKGQPAIYRKTLRSARDPIAISPRHIEQKNGYDYERHRQYKMSFKRPKNLKIGKICTCATPPCDCLESPRNIVKRESERVPDVRRYLETDGGKKRQPFERINRRSESDVPDAKPVDQPSSSEPSTSRSPRHRRTSSDKPKQSEEQPPEKRTTLPYVPTTVLKPQVENQETQTVLNYHNRFNRLSARTTKPAVIQKISADSIQVLPPSDEDERLQQIDDYKRRREKAKQRGLKALEKNKVLQDYKKLLEELPVLQKQERLASMGKHNPVMHMNDNRYNELERKRQNRLENEFESFQNKTSAYDIPLITLKSVKKSPPRNEKGLYIAVEPTEDIALNVGQWQKVESSASTSSRESCECFPKDVSESLSSEDKYLDEKESEEIAAKEEELAALLRRITKQREILLKEAVKLPVLSNLKDILNEDEICSILCKGEILKDKIFVDSGTSPIQTRDSKSDLDNTKTKPRKESITTTTGSSDVSHKVSHRKSKKSHRRTKLIKETHTQTTPSVTKRDKMEVCPKSDIVCCSNTTADCLCVKKEKQPPEQKISEFPLESSSDTDKLCEIIIKAIRDANVRVQQKEPSSETSGPNVVIKVKGPPTQDIRGKMANMSTSTSYQSPPMLLASYTDSEPIPSVNYPRDTVILARSRDRETQVEPSESIGQPRESVGKPRESVAPACTLTDEPTICQREKINFQLASLRTSLGICRPTNKALLQPQKQQTNINDFVKVGDKAVNPRLMKYIKRLLDMSRQSIDDLAVSSVSDISTPQDSVVHISTNVAKEKLQNVMDHFNLTPEDIKKYYLSTSTMSTSEFSSNGPLAETSHKKSFSKEKSDKSPRQKPEKASISLKSQETVKGPRKSYTKHTKTQEISTGIDSTDTPLPASNFESNGLQNYSTNGERDFAPASISQDRGTYTHKPESTLTKRSDAKSSPAKEKKQVSSPTKSERSSKSPMRDKRTSTSPESYTKGKVVSSSQTDTIQKIAQEDELGRIKNIQSGSISVGTALEKPISPKHTTTKYSTPIQEALEAAPSNIDSPRTKSPTSATSRYDASSASSPRYITSARSKTSQPEMLPSESCTCPDPPCPCPKEFIRIEQQAAIGEPDTSLWLHQDKFLKFVRESLGMTEQEFVELGFHDMFAKHIDLTDYCQDRINSLMDLIKRVREDKKSICSPSPVDNSVTYTSYLDLPPSKHDVNDDMTPQKEEKSSSVEESSESSGSSISQGTMDIYLLGIESEVSIAAKETATQDTQTKEQKCEVKFKFDADIINVRDQPDTFVPMLQGIPKYTGVECAAQTRDIIRAKLRPPPSLLRSNMRGQTDAVPHELSTIAEAETLISSRNTSALRPHSPEEREPSRDVSPRSNKASPKLEASYNSPNHTQTDSGEYVTITPERIIASSSRSPKGSFRRSPRTGFTSSSSYREDPYGKSSTSGVKPFSDSTSESPDELENMLRKFNLEWAISLVKKTEQALALSSSSSSSDVQVVKRDSKELSLPNTYKQLCKRLTDASGSGDRSQLFMDLSHQFKELKDISEIIAQPESRSKSVQQRTSTPVQDTKSTDSKDSLFKGESELSSVRNSSDNMSDNLFLSIPNVTLNTTHVSLSRPKKSP